MIIAGTLPVGVRGLKVGRAQNDQGHLVVDGCPVDVWMGTGTLIATTLNVCEFFGLVAPLCIVSNDPGDGAGSDRLYDFLSTDLWDYDHDLVVLHYMVPDRFRMMDFALEAESYSSFRLVADAGGMYAAKVAGVAALFELFTPDLGELAFLADAEASHPLFVKDALYGSEPDVLACIDRARGLGNAARVMLVKGVEDVIADGSGVVASVREPNIPALEAIGGTGDMVLGITAGLMDAGLPTMEAAIEGARVARLAGELAGATPRTHVSTIIEAVPKALDALNLG